MRAFIYHNTAEDHFFGWKPEHAGKLDLVAIYDSCEGDEPTETLEWLFAEENIGDHEGRRSFSVGDVILLEDDAEVQTAWACASSGWLRLSDGAVRIVPV